jgi:hypothetical protein
LYELFIHVRPVFNFSLFFRLGNSCASLPLFFLSVFFSVVAVSRFGRIQLQWDCALLFSLVPWPIDDHASMFSPLLIYINDPLTPPLHRWSFPWVAGVLFLLLLLLLPPLFFHGHHRLKKIILQASQSIRTALSGPYPSRLTVLPCVMRTVHGRHCGCLVFPLVCPPFPFLHDRFCFASDPKSHDSSQSPCPCPLI